MKKLFLTLMCVVFLSAAPAMADVNRSLNFSIVNDSAYSWSGFNFFIFEYPEEIQIKYPFFEYDIQNVEFVDSGLASPDSSQSPLTWETRNNGQELELFFSSDPVHSGESASFSVDILNPDNVLYGVGYSPVPVIVPEPISSVLFLIGGATLGFRRFRKK